MPFTTGRLLVATLLGLAILPAALPAQDLRATRFDRLSVEDGLSYNRVWAIQQDTRGFLWIGTVQGLNRYDGYGFRIYKHRPDDPGSLSENVVTTIYQDRLAELWIGTCRGARGSSCGAVRRSEPDPDCRR